MVDAAGAAISSTAGGGSTQAVLRLEGAATSQGPKRTFSGGAHALPEDFDRQRRAAAARGFGFGVLSSYGFLSLGSGV